jgi:hypothetical protein
MGVALTILIAVLGLIFSVTETLATGNDIKETVALFPFENFSDDKTAPDIVMPEVRRRLEEKGVEVLNDNALNAFLLKERIRSTGYISKDRATKVAEELRVSAIMIGSIKYIFNY